MRAVIRASNLKQRVKSGGMGPGEVLLVWTKVAMRRRGEEAKFEMGYSELLVNWVGKVPMLETSGWI